MNDMEKKHHEALKAAFEAEHKIGELPDDALDAAVGGAVLTGPVSIAVCTLCGWNAAYDRKGQNDLEILVMDHIFKSPDCLTNFLVYDF